jgi:hypothetical protein
MVRRCRGEPPQDADFSGRWRRMRGGSCKMSNPKKRAGSRRPLLGCQPLLTTPLVTTGGGGVLPFPLPTAQAATLRAAMDATKTNTNFLMIPLLEYRKTGLAIVTSNACSATSAEKTHTRTTVIPRRARHITELTIAAHVARVLCRLSVCSLIRRCVFRGLVPIISGEYLLAESGRR